MISFERTQFCVVVGLSLDGKRCGLYVDTFNVNNDKINVNNDKINVNNDKINTKVDLSVLKPHYDQKYITKYIFKFRAAKKSPFGNIITTLRECGIYPDGCESNFKPTENPDNKFYTSLLSTELEKIMSIIRLCIHGMTVVCCNDEIKSLYDELKITDDEFESTCKYYENCKISLVNGLSCCVINEKSEVLNIKL